MLHQILLPFSSKGKEIFNLIYDLLTEMGEENQNALFQHWRMATSHLISLEVNRRAIRNDMMVSVAPDVSHMMQ